MQSTFVTLIIMGASIALALAGLELVRRRYPDPVRAPNNEVAGFFIAVLGVMYAVLLAFVIVTVWEQFEEARLTTEREANAVAGLYRASQALPEPAGSRLRAQARDYVRTMVDLEWPAMARGQTSPESKRAVDALWATVLTHQPVTDNERIVQGEIMRRMGELNDNRRLRELAATTSLPHVMWALLAGGAIISVLFTYFFSTKNARAQYAMTGLYVASIAFVLVLISVLDLPFSGNVYVTPHAFENALETFERVEAALPPGRGEQAGEARASVECLGARP